MWFHAGMSCETCEVEPAVCIFDGDCEICQFSVRLARHFRARVDFIPFQEFDFANAPIGLRPERAQCEVVLITPVGKVYGGAAAVAQILRASRIAPLGKLLDARLVLPAAQIVYSWVARNRSRLPRACGVNESRKPSTEY